MNLTKHLFHSAEKTWEKYLSHPYILEMAEGKLPMERFKRYMLIDYAYLKEYINILAAGISRTDNFTEAAYLISHMQETVEETLRSHIPLLEKLQCSTELKDIELPEKARQYVDYMMNITANGSFFDCILVLLCCSWSYAYIAENITKKYPSCVEHSLYGTWFLSYASEDYRAANKRLMDMVDEYSKDFTEAAIDRYTDIFKKCSEYELMFWNIL